MRPSRPVSIIEITDDRARFLPYDFTRQGRKSWFVSDSEITRSTTNPPLENIKLNSFQSPSRIKLSEQPNASMISKIEGGSDSLVGGVEA